MTASREQPRTHRNRRVVDAALLHKPRVRRERGKTLIEGPHLLEEALGARGLVEVVFARPDDQSTAETVAEHGVELVHVDERALGRLAGTETPRGPIGVVAFTEGPLRPDRNLLVAWGVSDPGNVGTMIRTAVAFGWDYAYTEGSADPWAPKVVRSGTGAHFHTRITRIDGLEDLMDFETVATVVRDGSEPAMPNRRPVALLIGEEAAGLPPNVVESCSRRVTIPMPGPVESLNAAVAAGILLYESTPRIGPIPNEV